MFNLAAFKKRVSPSAEKLRCSQLKDGSTYSNLRMFVPIPVLCMVWLGVVHQSFTYPLQSVLSRPVTMRHLLVACGIASLWNICLRLSSYSRRSVKVDILAEVSRLSSVSLTCGLLPLLIHLEGGTFGLGLLLAALTTIGMLVASFGLLGSFLIAAMLSPRLIRSRVALIVGSGTRAAELRRHLENHYARFQIFGCVDDQYCGNNQDIDNYLGTIDTLPEILKAQPIEVVLIGLSMRSNYDDIQKVMGICEIVGVESHYMLDIFETSRARVKLREPQPLTVLNPFPYDPKQYLKRVIDFVLALFFVVVFSPVMLAAALAVRLSSPGPILFVQKRYGLHRKRFPMFKLRSMVCDAEERQASLESQNQAQGPVFKMKSDPRVTRVGAFLRRTSIDELPQLFNVLRGEMSIVGPRPLPIRDVSRFEESWLLRRFSVKPGLTCLWQVNGRSDSTFDFWIRQDLTYIDTWSLMLDLKILFLTIPAVLKGKGAV